MYGMSNRAIQELITSEFGEPAWIRAKARAGVGSSPDAVLERFGEYWVGYAARQGYRDLLRSRGESLFSFIARLDDLHSRLLLVFPRLRPPSFRAQRLDDECVRLDYISERDGLAPFVVGLIRGLATLFGEAVQIQRTARRDHGHPYEEFLLRVA